MTFSVCQYKGWQACLSTFNNTPCSNIQARPSSTHLIILLPLHRLWLCKLLQPLRPTDGVGSGQVLRAAAAATTIASLARLLGWRRPVKAGLRPLLLLLLAPVLLLQGRFSTGWCARQAPLLALLLQLLLQLP